MAEWSNAAVLKTVVRVTGPGVRIPHSPLFYMKFYTYILKSLYDGTYYYGSTKDIHRRLSIHNKGKVRYTKGRRPWKLHYSEEYETYSEAFRRERFFKSIEGYRFLKSKGII